MNVVVKLKVFSHDFNIGSDLDIDEGVTKISIIDIDFLSLI